MKLNRGELTLLFIYIFILGVSGIYFLVFNSVYAKNRAINEQIEMMQQALTKLDAILTNKDEVEKEYKAFEQKLSTKEIKPTVSTEILQDIKSKATQAGLNVVNIKPFALKEEGLYGEFSFRLETEGEIKNFGRFLYNLDESAYIFTIKFLQLNAQSQEAQLKIQLLLSALLAKG